MLMATPELLIDDVATTAFAVQCLRNKERAFGWIYRSTDFSDTDPLGPASVKGITLKLNNMAPGKFRVEFWDTVAGKPVSQLSIPSKDGALTAGVPAFARDIAFKVKRQK